MSSDIYVVPEMHEMIEAGRGLPAHEPKPVASTTYGGTGFSSVDYDDLSALSGMFTGSTIPGTMPLPRPWRLDYYALRERSWQAYTENELACAFLDRLRHFVINVGLKCQFEPSTLLNLAYGIDITDDAKTWVEKDFEVYSGSKMASLCGNKDLHALADQAYLNMNNAGDLLVVLHVVNGDIKVQHIDGGSIVNPWERSTMLNAVKKGHTISNGVEYDKRGREVAYYVRQNNFFATNVLNRNLKDSMKTVRIPAYGPSGRLVAFRPNRDNQRIGSSRGKPLLTSTLQNLEVTRRYKLAELLAAEVNAMIVWAIEHDEKSFGENSLAQMPTGTGRRPPQAPEMNGGWSADNGDKIAGRLTASTSGMAINMGRGQTLKATDTKRPNVDGAAFLESMNVDTASAATIPFEISRMLFTDSYSASRAALGMFELIVDFERKLLTDQYYTPIATERLRLRALQGKIPVPDKYRTAIAERDEFFMSAVENFRYTGVVMPDVDPLKEVKAARERIDGNLSTYEKETEKLGCGDFEENTRRKQKEVESLDNAGLLPTVNDEQNGDEDGPTEDEK